MSFPKYLPESEASRLIVMQANLRKLNSKIYNLENKPILDVWDRLSLRFKKLQKITLEEKIHQFLTNMNLE